MYFKQIGTNLVNKLTKSDGPPPDKTLENCRENLKLLTNQINTVRKQFDNYTQCLQQTTESSCVLSNTISKFYEEADHSGTRQWVKTFQDSQEGIANFATKLCQTETNGHKGLCSELDNWIQRIQQADQHIMEAEKSRAAVISTTKHLQTLKETFDRKKNNTGGGFFGNSTSDEELKQLQNSINESTNAQKLLQRDYNEAKKQVENEINSLMKDRFKHFDKIFVQLLEFQHELFNMTKKLTESFNKPIGYYRSQFPKTMSQNPSNINNNNSNSVKQENIISKTDVNSPNSKSTPILTNNFKDNVKINGKNNINKTKSPSKPKIPRQPSNRHTDFLDFDNTSTYTTKHNQDDDFADMFVNNNNNNNNDNNTNNSKSNNIFNDDFEPTHTIEKSNEMDFMGFVTSSSTSNGTSQTNHLNGNHKNNQNSKPLSKQMSGFDWWFNDSHDTNNNNNKTRINQSKPKTATNNNSTNDKKTNLSNPTTKQNSKPTNKNSTSPTKHGVLHEDRDTIQQRIKFVKESYLKEQKAHEDRQNALDKYQKKIDAWEFQNGVRRNIRSLLTKLPELLWPEANWKPVSLSELMTVQKCRKHYMKALRVVHPDRARNRGDGPERLVICERAFTALNEAWKEFEKKN